MKPLQNGDSVTIIWSDNTTTPWTSAGIETGSNYFTIPDPDKGAREELEKLKKELKKESTMNLYRVYAVYATDRKNPIVITTGSVVANDKEEAKLKSGVFQKIEPSWDTDYITILVELIGEVKVKGKAQEVKQV